MDEKLNRRLQLAGAAAVAVAYFLPWASIMSPFGSIQPKGLYIDYAWALLLLTIVHIGVQFVASNREAFGIPENIQPYITLLHRIIPLAIFAFVAWQGAWFSFNVRKPVGATLFGNEMGSAVKAGLDYGYWLAACGGVLLVLMVALSVKQMIRFGFAVAGILVITMGIAFGLTHSNQERTATMASATTLPTATEATTPSVAAPEFESSPYIQLVSVKARIYGKDYDASRFSPEIVITPTFRNVGNKMIVGIRGRIAVMDAFGREVYSFGFKDDDKLAIDAESRHSGGYVFKDNQFDDDDPFSKMYPVVSADNAKYSVKIAELAFADGSVLPSSTGSSK